MSYDICPASDLITQGFGCTDFTSEWIAAWCPSKRYHSGIDLGMTVGSLWHQPVYATRAGTIIAIGIIGAGDTGFYTYLGNQAVCLKTHDSGYIIYAHLDVANVTVGQAVQIGAQIGLVGTRGNSTGPHLHVEVRTDGARQNVWNNAAAVLDPRPYLNDLTGGTAGSEIIAGGLMTRGQKVNAVEDWYAIYLHLNYGDPDWPGGADKAGPDITQWANQIQDDGENLDAVRGQFIGAVKSGAPDRYAWFEAAKHPVTTGPAAPPHKHTVTGIADINT